MADEPEDDEFAEDGSPDGRQARWDGHNEARRKRLLDAAIELLDERPPGTELRMAEIAERAGLRRPVIYRYFTDRQDLQAAIDQEIARRLVSLIMPIFDPHKPVIDIIHDSIAVYVHWSEEHPGLRHVIDRGFQTAGGSVQKGVSDLALLVSQLVFTALQGFRVRLRDSDLAYVDPLVHGLIEAVVGTVRRWVSLEERPPAGMLVHLATESVWYIMAGHAHALGMQLERDQKLAELPDLD
ncbi:TetR/AcrR family transcriptional regulator [Janibacter sp. GS2]|uniref:TetR/AcrR family transcriptional regulator n=1 Tax=Janibacter sp. GS2 TaxID=3442646 RepID=UPI003EB8B86D